MPVFVVPVKSFRGGKRRLSALLDHDGRAELGRRLADHVATTVTTAGHRVLVVSSDPEVAAWAGGSGHLHVADPGNGLDSAASAGIGSVNSGGWVVLHSDLPLLAVDDIEALARVLDSGGQPIAPSSDGGTSAIGGHAPLDFSFGPASFHRHLARLTDPRVVVTLGLTLDVDSPADLHAAAVVDPRWRPIS